jgi:4-hydroxy-tetrahydrodipicolinate reductase
MNIALIGYGKMGKAIEEIALQKGHNVVLKIDAHNPDELTNEHLQTTDVAIEFTNADNAPANLIKCFDAGIPVVCGTTGWLSRWEEIKKICGEKKGSLVYASNYSIGVNIFFELNKRLAELMQNHTEYEVEVEEIHHTEKKDAPSGTAITIAEEILKHLAYKKKWVNHFTDSEAELTVISKRIDPAAGTHKITYHSGIDDIEIIHTAHNRKGFAAGAVLAAEFLQNKTGIFSMKDLLGL